MSRKGGPQGHVGWPEVGKGMHLTHLRGSGLHFLLRVQLEHPSSKNLIRVLT